MNAILHLLLMFAGLSLLSVGGGMTILPEMHRLAVIEWGWMPDQVFADYYALAQAAPGPNILIVTLLGWHVAGFAGALAATVGICAPAAALAYVGGGVWVRFRDTGWRRIVGLALPPLVAGLVLGAGVLLTDAATHSVGGAVLTAAMVLFATLTRANPLWLLGIGALAGALGLV